MRALVDLEELSEEDKVRADTTKSGEYSVKDAIRILQYIVGL